MQQLLCLCLLLIASLPLHTQTDTDWQKQIGTDITPLFTRLLNFGGTTSATELSFFYRYKKPDSDHNLRIGAGLTVAINEGGNNIDNIDIALSFGEEKRRAFGRRWEAYAGWDIRTGVEHQRFGNIDQNLSYLNFGFGPVAGLNFRLNTNLLLSTEAALPLILRTSLGDTNEGTSLRLRWQVPSVLYLHYRW